MFNQATRQSFLQLNPIPYGPSSIQSIQLPQVGFLSRIIIPITAVISTSGAGTYATNTFPVSPYGLIRRVIVRTNEGAEIYNTSGEGNYLVQRMMTTGVDVRNPFASVQSTNTSPAVFSIPANMTTNSTYTFQFALVLPIAWARSLQAGLILLQNPTTRLTVEIQWGDASVDLATTAGGAITVNSVSTSPCMEMFNVPASVQDYPDMSYVHVILEDISAIGSTGDFQYRPPLGNLYLRAIQEFYNNGARMTPQNFAKLSLTYSQTQTAYVLTPTQQLVEQRYRYGIDLPDGVFAWDFTLGTGLLEMPNARDVIDTSRLTDLSITSTITGGTALTNAGVRTVREMLAPISR